MERNEFYDYVYCGRHRLDSGNHHFSIAQQLSNYFRLDYLVLHKFLVRLVPKSDALILSETGMTSLAFAPEHSA